MLITGNYSSFLRNVLPLIILCAFPASALANGDADDCVERARAELTWSEFSELLGSRTVHDYQSSEAMGTFQRTPIGYRSRFQLTHPLGLHEGYGAIENRASNLACRLSADPNTQNLAGGRYTVIRASINQSGTILWLDLPVAGSPLNRVICRMGRVQQSVDQVLTRLRGYENFGKFRLDSNIREILEQQAHRAAVLKCRSAN